VCSGGKCQAPTCLDLVKNGTETDVDCGGSCGPCTSGKLCGVASDCQSLVCTGNPKSCQVPSCADLVKNQGETDVDCGGATICARCGTSKACVGAGDCASRVCSGSLCQAAVCNDGVKNQNETDIDCGGVCPHCGTGQTCSSGADCTLALCIISAGNTSPTCQPQSCADGIKNQTETDTDCGGTAGCAKCTAGRACAVGTDCDCQFCNGGVCSSQVCGDGIQCGTEACDDGANDQCGGCNTNCTAPGTGAGVQTCRCADATVEQACCGSKFTGSCWLNLMAGCAGAVPFASRSAQCGNGFKPCTAQEWVTNQVGNGIALNSGCKPTHDYWTADSLSYGGTATASCSAVLGKGTPCSVLTGSPSMHVCLPSQGAAADPEGNTCNWTDCGFGGLTPDEWFGGCAGGTAGTLCCPSAGCASGTNSQAFYEGMVGCAGAVPYPSRASLCAAGWHPCKAEQWIARSAGFSPSHHYWVDDALFYSGTGSGAGICSVSRDVGTDCGAAPMRVCYSGAGGPSTDPEGNVCNWVDCGYNTLAADHYFGGCSGNNTAGTLCCQ
jgi:hypothetical protein